MGFFDQLSRLLSAGTGKEELGAVDQIERALRIGRGETFEPTKDPLERTKAVIDPDDDFTRGLLQSLDFAPEDTRALSPQRATESFITPPNLDPSLGDVLAEGAGRGAPFVVAGGIGAPLAGGGPFAAGLTTGERIAGGAALGAIEGAQPIDAEIDPSRIVAGATAGAAFPAVGAGFAKLFGRGGAEVVEGGVESAIPRARPGPKLESFQRQFRSQGVPDDLASSAANFQQPDPLLRAAAGLSEDDLIARAATGDTASFRASLALSGTTPEQAESVISGMTRNSKGQIVSTAKRGENYAAYLREQAGGEPVRNVPNVDIDNAGTQALKKSGTIDPSAPETLPATELRAISPKKVKPSPELLNSIRENGIREPVEIGVTARGTRVLFEGNHRLAAAERLGITEIPTRTVPIGDELASLLEVEGKLASPLKLKDMGPQVERVRRALRGDRPFVRLKGDPQFQADTIARKAMRAAGMSPSQQNEALAAMSPQARQDLALRYEQGARDAAGKLAKKTAPKGTVTLKDVVATQKESAFGLTQFETDSVPKMFLGKSGRRDLNFSTNQDKALFLLGSKLRKLGRGGSALDANARVKAIIKALGGDPESPIHAKEVRSAAIQMQKDVKKFAGDAPEGTVEIPALSKPFSFAPSENIAVSSKSAEVFEDLFKRDTSRSGLTGEEGHLLIGKLAENAPKSKVPKIRNFLAQLKGKRPRYQDAVAHYYNAMLLSTGRIRDILSNTFELGESIATRSIRRGLTNPTQLHRQFMIGDGVMEAFRNAGEAFRTGLVREIREGVPGVSPALTGQLDLPLQVLQRKNPLPAQRLIAMIDDFYGTLAYNMDVGDRIAQRAIKTVGTSSKEALENEIIRLRSNVPEDIANEAFKVSRRVTFRDIPTSEIESGLLSATRKFQNVPVVGPTVLPFGPTLLRLGKRSIEYSPLNYLNTLGKLIVGNTSEHTANSFIRGTYGSAAIYSLYHLANAGLISGEAKHLSTAEKNVLRASGWQPQSVKVGDNWLSYRNWGPVSFAFRFAADTSEDIRAGDSVEGALTKNYTEAVVESTFLPGLNDTIDMIVDPDSYKNEDITGVYQKIQPFSGLAQIARAVDPIVRERPDSFDDALIQRLPGGQTLAERGFEDLEPQNARLGLFGEEIRRDGNFFELMMSPVRRSEVTNDPILQEVARLLPISSETGNILTIPDIRNIELTEAEDWTARKVMGAKQKEMVSNVINSPGYQNLPDESKARALSTAHSAARNLIRSRVKHAKALKVEITENALRTGKVGL